MNPPVSKQLVKFLLVDDLEDNLLALRALLKREGLELLQARSGPEALELLLVHDVALAILDVQMPGMDGFELAELMRGTERTRRIPIIFITAGMMDAQRRFRGYEKGAVDFLFKPIEPHILSSKAEVFYELYCQRQEVACQRDALLASATRLEAANAQLEAEIAERRRTEATLRQSEERLRLAAEAARFGTYDADLLANRLYWSPQLKAIVGVPPEAEPPPPDSTPPFIHPEDAEHVRQVIQRACEPAGNGVVEDEHRIVRPDGSVRWVQVKGQVQFAGDWTTTPAGTIHGGDRRYHRPAKARATAGGAESRSGTGRRRPSARRVPQRADRFGHSPASRIPRRGGDRGRGASSRRSHLFRTHPGHLWPGHCRRADRGPGDRQLRPGDVRGQSHHLPAHCDGRSVVRAWRELCAAHGIRAAHSTPIFGPDGMAVAALFMVSGEARPPGEWELRLADFGAHMAAIVLERQRAAASLRRSERSLAAELDAAQRLHEVSTQLIQADDIEALYARILDTAAAILHSDFASLQMLHPEAGHGGALRLLGYRGFSPEAAALWEWVTPASQSTCGEALRTGRRVLVTDVHACDFLAGTDGLRAYLQTGIRAVQTTPLFSRTGALLGMISTHWREPHEPAASELRALDVLARQAADLIERKRSEDALVHAKAVAETANAAKSQFLANMSHELRTPMNAILGMIDVALPKATDPTVQDCLRTAKGSADLLLTLLNHVLDSAKIESGKLELESAPFSLRRMLDQITRVLSVQASEKGLSFYCRIPEKTPDAVLGDRTRTQQVLLNLAGNGIKFTEHGEVEIGLHASTSDGQAHLEFFVRDTGIGIPPERLEHIFEPFAQADASMTRRFGGTGLGLSIAKNLAEMMGGTIGVESQVGKGSTFYFTVRLPLTDEPPVDFEAPAVIPSTAPGPLRILLAEDNPANQKLATYLLQDRGHVVEIACDGHEAIALAERNRYDVILMDVQMPGMGGLEATTAIRRRENSNSRVPIIAMTAHAMKGDREVCLAAGMDGYLSKPVHSQELIGLVESLACNVWPRGLNRHARRARLRTGGNAHAGSGNRVQPRPGARSVLRQRENAAGDGPILLQGSGKPVPADARRVE
jgi:PAS domain S-box-containing protein